MQRRRHPHHRLYLFNLAHQTFVEGEVETLPTVVTPEFAIRQFAYLFLIIALPVALFITMLVAWAGYPIELLLIVELITALVASAYFVIKAYRRDKILCQQGTIIYGDVIRHEKLPGYSNIGTSTVTRIFYRFLTPQQVLVIGSIDLNYVLHCLPDGRKYPVTGTPVAILYANDKIYKLL